MRPLVRVWLSVVVVGIARWVRRRRVGTAATVTPAFPERQPRKDEETRHSQHHENRKDLLSQCIHLPPRWSLSQAARVDSSTRAQRARVRRRQEMLDGREGRQQGGAQYG